MTILLDPDHERKIRDHGSTAYHEEACGVLIGSEDRSKGSGPDEVVVHVAEVRPVDNTKTDERQRRYLIDPRVMIELEKEFETDRLDLVGIYHSHPDHPAQPSDFDKDHALPGLSYLILGVSEGYPDALTSWRLSDDRKNFHEEPIKYTARGDDGSPEPPENPQDIDR